MSAHQDGEVEGRKAGRRRWRALRWIDYPRGGRRGFRRWLPSWRQLLVVVGLPAVALTGLAAWFYATTEVPKSFIISGDE